MAIAVAGVLLQPVAVLRATTAEGQQLACRRVATGDTITLAFDHSMYGGEVRERYRVSGTELVRIGFETDTAAAAEYYAFHGAIERTPDGFAVPVGPMQTEALVIRVDQIGRHRLLVGSDAISLADHVRRSAAVTVSTRQVPLLLRLADSNAGCGPSQAAASIANGRGLAAWTNAN